MSKKINDEIRIYGENAVLSVFKNRPQDIIQLFLTKENLKKFQAITKYCAQVKRAYHFVTVAELDKMTKATHHEGVCMLIKKKKEMTFDSILKSKNKKSLLIALENVSNPHNVGAILRSAAHFGVDALLISDKKIAEANSSIRTSEGGFEFVPAIEIKDFKKSILELKKLGFQIVTTSSHQGTSLYDFKFTDKIVLFFGEEGDGLSKETLKSGDLLMIPGTNNVESLNVSVATAVILSEIYRQGLK